MIIGGIITSILESIGVFALLMIGLALSIIAFGIIGTFNLLKKLVMKPFTLLKMPDVRVTIFNRKKKKGGK